MGMFLHTTKNIADFKTYISRLTDTQKEALNKSIVFIGNGEAIYTHGKYYGDGSQLKYFSTIAAGGKQATAAGPNGIINFSSTDDASVECLVDTTGIKIGVSAAYKTAVTNAINTAKLAAIDDAAGKYLPKGSYESAGAAGAVKTALIGKNTDTVSSDTIWGAKKYADSLASNYDVAGAAAAVDAKLATEITRAKDAEKVNSDAIAVLNGTGTGSVSNQVATAIANVVANAPADFDTLKEIADWISNDTTGAASLSNKISSLETKVGNSNVSTQISNAINNLYVTDTAVATKYVSSVSLANGKITVARETLPTYTLSTGGTNGTVLFNTTEVAVKGLGSAAYTNSNAYATAAQGQKANTAYQKPTGGIPLSDLASTVYTKTEVDALFAWTEF